MIPRELFEEINVFLKAHGLTKVKLIKEGYKALREQERDKSENEQLNNKDDPSGRSG